MAFNTQQRFMSLGMPTPLAKELGSQIDSGVYNWQRLQWSSMEPDLARYLATSLTAGTFNAVKATELGMIPAWASLVTSVIQGIKLPFGATIVAAGDSITAQGFSATSTTSNVLVRGLFGWGLTFARNPFRLIAGSNAGVGGNTSQQLRDRYVTDVTSKAPGVVVLLIGTNDLTSVNPSVTLANIDWMISANIGINAHTFLMKVLPRGSIASPMIGVQLNAWEAVNAGIVARASAKVTVVDAEPFIGNMDANHTMLPGISTADDFLHPNQLGAYLAGKALSASFLSKASTGSILDTVNNAAGNLVTNGFVTGTAGTIATATGQVATSWIGQGSTAGGATVTYSKVARSDGFGEWQQVEASGTYTGAGKVVRLNRAINVTGLLNAGDVVRAFCEIEVDAGATNVIATRIFADFGGTAGSMTTLKEFSAELATAEAWSGVLASMPFTLAATPTNLNLDVGMLFKTTGTTDPVSARFRVGRIRVEKVV